MPDNSQGNGNVGVKLSPHLSGVPLVPYDPPDCSTGQAREDGGFQEDQAQDIKVAWMETVEEKQESI